MNKRILGKTGIEVSEISFGGVEIGLPYGIGVDSPEQMPSDEDAVKLLRSALDNGINYFDTSRLYGKSENIIGKAFSDKRDDVIICSKCSHLHDKNNHLLPAKELKKSIEDSFYKSTTALKTDYIDVYMLHNATVDLLESQDIKDIFAQYKKKGLVRAIGATVYSVAETKKAIDSQFWEVIQLPFNILDQRHGETFSSCYNNGIAVIVRSVLCKGVLTKKNQYLHPELEAVKRHIHLYKQFMNSEIKTLSELAIKFALSFKEVSSVLVGIDKMEYLQKSIAVADGNYLNEDTLKLTKTLAYPEPEFLDLPRWERMGWLT